MDSHSENLFNEQEFKELYFNYYPIIFKVAIYLLKEESEAEDAVQEVFLKIWQAPSILDEVENVKVYLITITRNLVFDKLKKQKKEKEHILQLESLSIVQDEIDESAFKEALELAVSQLPPKCRLIFSLSRFEGLSNDEIAEYLEISKRTVETQISLALKAFRGDLRPIFESYLSGITLPVLALLLHQL